MLWVGFESTIPAFERAKTVHALDRAAAVIGNGQQTISVANDGSTTFPRKVWSVASRKMILLIVIAMSQGQGYFTTGGLPPISSSWRQAPWDSLPELFFWLKTCGYSPYATSSLAIGWVCHLKLLLVLPSAAILGFRPRENPSNWRVKSPYLYAQETGRTSYNPRQWVPFSSPPMTRRATMEVFEPASTLCFIAMRT
jgi:hypothetical protein